MARKPEQLPHREGQVWCGFAAVQALRGQVRDPDQRQRRHTGLEPFALDGARRSDADERLHPTYDDAGDGVGLDDDDEDDNDGDDGGGGGGGDDDGGDSDDDGFGFSFGTDDASRQLCFRNVLKKAALPFREVLNIETFICKCSSVFFLNFI